MNEIIIIVTREVDGCPIGQQEWVDIWNMQPTEWLAIFDNNYKCHKFDGKNKFDKNTIKLIIFKGGAICFKGAAFNTFVSTFRNGERILMAIHPGGIKSFNETKDSLFKVMNANSDIIEDAVEYSLGCQNPNEINHPVAKFAHSPCIETFEKLRQFILNKKLKPHLIALSILCQGYLAAHGGNGLKGWDGLLDDLKRAAKSNWPKVKKDWWIPAFGTETDFKNTGVGKDLMAMGKDCEKDKGAIKALFNAIQESNGKDFADTYKVTKAYGCIKEILKGK